jgi:phage-related protein
MTWNIIFYSDKICKAIEEWPIYLQARYIKLVEAMKQYGCNLGEPHTKSLGKGLFELRIKASEGISRVFYCTLSGKTIVILHAFVKKTNAIPKKELEVAQKRLKEVKDYEQRK